MMTLPTITCICCTYGRVEHLQEAVACFLKQDYDGSKKLVILNSLPKQVLAFNHPEVEVHNLTSRPPTMGETRNMAIAHAPEDSLLVVWDDDDLYLPHYLSTVVRGFEPGKHEWTRLSRQAYMEGAKIKSIVNGSANTFAFTKKAWSAVGGYSTLSVGEDRQIIGKITSQFAGQVVQLADTEVSFIYRWGTGVYHLSGEGDDKPGRPDAMNRAEAFVQEQIGCFRELTGQIELKPQLKLDYERMLATFVGGVVRLTSGRRGRIGFVNLGHAGDIINALPMVKYVEAVTGRKPLFFTSQTYGHVLDGVSYAEPVYLDLPDHKPNDAIQIASQRCEYVLCTQMHGENFEVPHETESYNREGWRVCGLLDRFYELPLVFDKRDFGREEMLLAALHKSDKPILLVNVTGGLSSPFSGGKALLEVIVNDFSRRFEVVDMTKLRFDRIYDALGLMDAAYLLVSSDTYTLHLAPAARCDVIALVNDNEMFGKDWLATRSRGVLVHRIGYSTQDAVSQVHDAIGTFSRPGHLPEGPNPTAYMPKFFHAVERHEDRGIVESERKNWARQSWEALYRTGMIPCHYTDYKRTSRDIGCDRNLPYLKDVLAHAMGGAEPDDCVVWTNDDVILHPLLLDALRTHVGIWGACTAMRTDFRHEPCPPLSLSPEELASKGERHMGRDLFAAKKSWLEKYWNELPDFVLGAEQFDLCLAAFVRSKVGHKLTRQNMDQVCTPAELPHGYVLHQWHRSVWAELPPNRPSAVHNRKLFRDWAAVNLPELRFYENGLI